MTNSASTVSNTRSYRVDRPIVVVADRSSHRWRASGTMVGHIDGGTLMRTGLGVDDVADLLEQPLIAVLATRRADDSIMLSPVGFEWYQGGIDIWVPTIEGGKVGHVQRDPRVTVVVANSEWPYRGFELRGEATVSTKPEDFYGALGRTALRYSGPEAAERMVAEYAPGAVIRVEPGTIRAWDYEDEA